ncbi:MAG: MFS transporter [Proteobacteria bacterium]|nr:MFS transporter [Pseudomonadota bacterium]
MTGRTLLSLILLTGIFFTGFLGRTCPAPLLPLLEADLSLDHAQAGALFLWISAGYFLALFGSGFLSAATSHRRVIQVSAAGVGASLLLVAVSRGLWPLRGSFFLVGLFAGLYLPSGIATLMGLALEKQWGRALGVHEIAPNLSFVAAPLVAQGLLSIMSWPGIFAILGAGSLLLFLLFTRFGQGGGFPGTAPGFHVLKNLASNRRFWVMTTLFALGISGTLGIFNMLPLYLVDQRGMDPATANALVAASRVSGLFMAFFAGWMVDKVGPGRSMALAFFLSGALTFLMGAASGPLFLVAVFLQPAAAVCFFPAGFVALSELGGPEDRNVAISVSVPPAFFVGAGLVPALLGLLADQGRFSLGFCLVGAFIATGTLVARRIS